MVTLSKGAQYPGMEENAQPELRLWSMIVAATGEDFTEIDPYFLQCWCITASLHRKRLAHHSFEEVEL